jgi:hypothetical protein
MFPQVSEVRARDRCLMITIAILLLTSGLVSCKEKAPEPGKVELFFRQIRNAVESDGATNVVVVQVNDSVGAGPDIERQVLEEIQSQLHAMQSVGIIEYPQSELEAAFRNLSVSPSDGISPANAMALAQQLSAGALLYASIESKAPDVYFKIYSGESGAVIFSNTLAGWLLPVTPPPAVVTDLLGTGSGTAQVGEAQSSGVVQPGATSGQ